MDAIADEKGDSRARYDTYAQTVNYGGDADFYGSRQNHVFPMKVGRDMVEMRELGITDFDLVQTVWDCWDKHRFQRNVLFLTGLEEMIQTSSDPRIIDIPFEDLPITSEASMARELLSMGKTFQDIDFIYDIIRDICGRTTFDVEALWSSTRSLSEKLLLMYEQAKVHLGDEYKYE